MGLVKVNSYCLLVDSMHEAERGLFELQRGRPLCVTALGDDGAARTVLLATVEGLSAQTLKQIQGIDNGRICLVVTRYRAEAMGLTRADHGRTATAGCAAPGGTGRWRRTRR